MKNLDQFEKNMNNLETLKIINNAVNLGFVFSENEMITDVKFSAEQFISIQKIKISPGQKVKFRITEVTDSRKQGSEVSIGKELCGEIDENLQLIYFVDKADVEWVFYIGVTCELIDNIK